ncbi:MAG TPA: OsmC family protein [Nitrospirota bacterium]|nr:OsmC family protein [Nitrospirota bacterium]
MNSERNLKEIVARRIELFRKKPEAAIYKPKVTSRHIKNLYTESVAREHLVKSDYGEAAGGDNQAPNPIEILLAAVAACIEAAFYEFAMHEGFTINTLAVDVQGTLDLRGFFMLDDVSAGFKDLQYTFSIESPDDETKIRELAEKVIAHCPVVDSLIKPTQVSGQIKVSKG